MIDLNNIEEIEAKAQDSFFSIPEKELRIYLIGMAIAPFLTCSFYQIGEFLVRLFSDTLTPLSAVMMFLFFCMSSFVCSVQFWYIWKNKEVLR